MCLQTWLRGGLAVGLWLGAASGARGLTVVYVDADAPGGGGGASWGDAFQDLQAALALAAGSTGQVEIRVAEGTYKPTAGADRTISFQLLEDVAILGGYAGYGAPNPNDRDTALYETILSGDIGTAGNAADNSYHVLTADSVYVTPVLDGFTITGGRADGAPPYAYGGGLHSLNANATISRCTIIGNMAQLEGGGMYFQGEGATISDCTFRNNTAATGGGLFSLHASVVMTRCILSDNTADEGGGLANLHGAPALRFCILSGNSASIRGGGMHNYCFGGGVSMDNCFIVGNAALSGGGMYNYGFIQPMLTGSLFAGNVATQDGGGIYHDTGVSSVSNCTLSANLAIGGSGGGIYCPNPAILPIVSNSILWGNVDSGGSDESAQLHGGAPMVDFSCVQGLTGSWGGTGNLGDNPQFVAAASGIWTAAATYDPATGWTTFTDAGAAWTAGALAGKTVNPNVTQARQLLIVSNTADSLSAIGDLAALGGSGVSYRIEDCHLAMGSPGIGAGDPNITPLPTATDIDGEPRIMDCRIDVGADEFTAGEPAPGDFDRSGAVEVGDIALFVQAVLDPALADVCVGDLNGDEILDGLDVALFTDLLLQP